MEADGPTTFYGLLSSIVSATATLTVTSLDFEGLEPGDRPDELRWEAGIGGEPVEGWVTVTGPGFGPMIFDTFCGGSSEGCSGGDGDPFQPDQGMALIISEDGASSDPDDSGAGGVVEFDFSHLRGGSVLVGYLVLIDAEEGGTAELWGDGELLDVVIRDGARDGEKAVRFVSEVSGVDFMRITLNGSGAIDDIGYPTAIHLTA